MRKPILSIALIGALAISLMGCNGGVTTLTGGISDDVIKVTQYKGLEIEKVNTGEITDSEIQQEIDQRLLADKEYESAGLQAVEGDIAVVDYEVYTNDKKVEGYDKKEVELTLGEYKEFPPTNGYKGLDDFIVGHKKGETIEAQVSTPDGLKKNGAPEMSIVKAKICDIKSMILPEFNDDWVKGQNVEAKNTAEYKEMVKKELQDIRTSTGDVNKRSAVMTALVNKCEFIKEPTEEIDNLYNSYISAYEQSAKTLNKDLDTYLKDTTGKEAQAAKDDIKTMAINSIKEKYALKLIAEKEKITVTDDEYNAAVESLAKDYGYTDTETFTKDFTKENLTEYVLQNKLIDFLVKNAKEVDSTEKVETTTQNADGTSKEGVTEEVKPQETPEAGSTQNQNKENNSSDVKPKDTTQQLTNF